MEALLDLTVLKAFGAAIAVLCLSGVAGAIGNVFNAAINAVARNPAAKSDIQSFAFIGAAFAEALGLMAVVIAFLILFTL